MKKMLPVLTAALIASAGIAQAEKLTIWLVGDDNNPKILQPAVDVFKSKNKGVEVEVRAIPWADAFTKYLAAVASKTGPDIITGGLSFGITLGEKGGMLDLNQKYPEFTSMVKKVAQQGVMHSVTALDGKLYAVPFDLTVQMMYYRSDIIANAPKTWAEYNSAVEKVRASGKKGGVIQWGNVGWLSFFPYLYQAGGTLYDAKCTKSTINSAQGVQALKYYSDFYTKYKAPTDGWPDIEAGLETGDYPLGITGQWAMSSLTNTHPNIAGKWKAAPLPAGPTGKRTAFIGGTVMGVTSYSKVPDLAVNFMKTVYDKSVGNKMMKVASDLGNLWLPAQVDLAKRVNLPNNLRNALVGQLKDAEGPANCNGWEESGSAVEKAIQGVIFNGDDPQAGLNTAAEIMNKNLLKK